MSFLLVTGKIFSCDLCKKVIQVEYEMGPSLTQIGDMNIIQQMEYSKNLGQPNESPETNGYYLYDFGICEVCYKEQIYSKDPQLEEIKQMLINKYQNLISQKEACLIYISTFLSENFERRIKTFIFDDVESFLGERFDHDLGDKYAKPKKKRGLWNQYFQQKIRDKVIPYLANSALKDSKVSKIVENHNQSSENSWVEQKDMFSENLVTIFFSNGCISMGENLNDYIEAESTVRFPVKDTPKANFYHQVEFDFDNDEDIFLISQEDLIGSLNEDIIVKSFKDRIEGLLHL
jgi:hypothetical protein